MGSACPNRQVARYYCDKCEEEFEPEALYVNEDGEELCTECFLSNYETVAQKER
jgi:formylmethanofuran dehydrogenase subunit E